MTKEYNPELNKNLETDLNDICEECKKEDESVTQNLFLTGFKICKSCRTSKTAVSYTHLTLPTTYGV